MTEHGDDKMLGRRILSLTFASLIATLAWSLTATAATHYVQNGESIGDVISNLAAAGDTILVGPGTYDSFTVDKEGLSIIGEEGPDNTKIVSDTSVAFTETADGSTLSGFEITISNSNGIYVIHRCHNLTIENNILSGSLHSGIYLDVPSSTSTLDYVIIRNNTIVFNKIDGIHVNQYDANSAVITGLAVQNNIISGNSRYGFYRNNNRIANFSGAGFSNNNFWNGNNRLYKSLLIKNYIS